MNSVLYYSSILEKYFKFCVCFQKIVSFLIKLTFFVSITTYNIFLFGSIEGIFYELVFGSFYCIPFSNRFRVEITLFLDVSAFCC